jgi:hypothetical protein
MRTRNSLRTAVWTWSMVMLPAARARGMPTCTGGYVGPPPPSWSIPAVSPTVAASPHVDTYCSKWLVGGGGGGGGPRGVHTQQNQERGQVGVVTGNEVACRGSNYGGWDSRCAWTRCSPRRRSQKRQNLQGGGHMGKGWRQQSGCLRNTNCKRGGGEGWRPNPHRKS